MTLQIDTPAETSTDGLTSRIARAIRDRLHFRPEVVLVASGSLPRFDMKADRFIRES